MAFTCRSGCGACCIAPSISSSIPGMPNGKVAGERCLHLDAESRCRLFGCEDRPEVCKAFQAEEAICGASKEEAIRIISQLECETHTD